MASHDFSKGQPSTPCAACGMLVESGAYHPYAACLMMQAARNGNTVEANLRAVVEYGMKAERQGVPLDEAMRRIGSVHHSEPPRRRHG